MGWIGIPLIAACSLVTRQTRLPPPKYQIKSAWKYEWFNLMSTIVSGTELYTDLNPVINFNLSDGSSSDNTQAKRSQSKYQLDDSRDMCRFIANTSSGNWTICNHSGESVVLEIVQPHEMSEKTGRKPPSLLYKWYVYAHTYEFICMGEVIGRVDKIPLGGTWPVLGLLLLVRYAYLVLFCLNIPTLVHSNLARATRI